MNQEEQRMKGAHHIICALTLFAASGAAMADQVIYTLVSDFVEAKSKFGKDVGGATWTETDEEGSLFGRVFGGLGVRPADGGPHLTIKLPVKVEAGEGTSNGKQWIAWARMMEPEALFTGNLANSMFFRMSADGSNWTPDQRGAQDLLWNDPGGSKNNLLFPESANGVDSLLTSAERRICCGTTQAARRTTCCSRNPLTVSIRS